MIVDIHSHVLPGLDDGAPSMEEAILLTENAAANGVTHIIATPHLNDKYRNHAKQIKEAVADLNKELFRKRIPVDIFPGQEVQFFSCLNALGDGHLLTLADGGKYLLIELPDDHFPEFTFELLFSLQIEGYIPIIPHPERNVVLRKEKQLLYELVTKGVLLQVTANSLFGANGRTAKKCSLELIKHNLVHFISSDAHHPIQRPFLLREGYQFIERKFSTNLRNYFIENAKHVLQGTDFQPLPPISFKHTRAYKR
ncbi:tyrosine-protein phosphatase [Sporosarcina contaminans]|uniref:Tyrosine-protein phosphatase n=1 Tax=Sporosarcina contaminans TaxID=633403 RepID=A0ABW3TXJ1_9BACL